MKLPPIVNDDHSFTAGTNPWQHPYMGILPEPNKHPLHPLATFLPNFLAGPSFIGFLY